VGTLLNTTTMANTALLWLLFLAEVDVACVVFSSYVAVIVVFKKKKDLLMIVTIAVVLPRLILLM
jgi:hypothetical protein